MPSDGLIIIYDMVPHEEVGRLPGYNEFVRDIEFIPDGDHLVSVSKHQLRAWHAPSFADIALVEKAEAAGPMTGARPQVTHRASPQMKRRHLIEIEDQSWCPRAIRSAGTDYLQFCLVSTKPYTPILPILAKALERAGTHRILDWNSD